MSYSIQNGLLCRDGKPVFGFGTSYYPSYHERKVPVPEDGDRTGELKKDIAGMAAAGFHIVRCAALGDVWYENGKTASSTPLIDAICEEAEKDGIGVMIRLQGYSMNISGYSDTMMIDSEGKPMDKGKWYNFVRDSLFHEGIKRDNDNGTAALARHFKEFPSVIAYQTYNEPHYPSGGILDYHPATLNAYREWLKLKFPELAEKYAEPPRSRPAEKGADTLPWVIWRLFSMEALSDFLGHCSDVAKTASGLETMTCLTTDPTNASNAARGVNFFDSAERMDALGITQYYMISKPEAFIANMNLDLAYSAAAVYDKPMWIIEYDARTDIPPENFRRLTYLAVGSGCKGIMYYQWRGDHVFPDSPEGNGFGLLNCDGTPTPNYPNALNVISLVSKLSDYIVSAKKYDSGVAILHSDYAYMNADAAENTGSESTFGKLENRQLSKTLRIYTELRKLGVAPGFLRAEDLEKMKPRVVIVPSWKLLSDIEREELQSFSEVGKVILSDEQYRYMTGFIPLGYKPHKFKGDYDLEDILRLTGCEPKIRLCAPSHYVFEVLDGNGYYFVSITNIANVEQPPCDLALWFDEPVGGAKVYSFDRPEGYEPETSGTQIRLTGVTDGAFVIVRKK